jgi:peptidoglycan hydrolase-like protein with peptidoglycan-binding domain
LRSYRAINLVIIAILLASTSLAAKATSHSVSAKSSKKVSSKSKSSGHSSKFKRASAKSKKSAWKRHGQQQIANDRTREIQTALIEAKYLNGKPSGMMDANTKEALSRYQKDNGWQGKVVPDSRALIKLGLGPDHSNLLNPTTAALPNYRPTEAGLSGNQQ